jgi:hypothetical protein
VLSFASFLSLNGGLEGQNGKDGVVQIRQDQLDTPGPIEKMRRDAGLQEGAARAVR